LVWEITQSQSVLVAPVVMAETMGGQVRLKKAAMAGIVYLEVLPHLVEAEVVTIKAIMDFLAGLEVEAVLILEQEEQELLDRVTLVGTALNTTPEAVVAAEVEVQAALAKTL